MLQEAPPASEAVQGVVPSAAPTKSAWFVPVVVGGSVKPMADAVLFVTVTNCSVEGTPTSCVPKSMLVGDTLMVGVSGNSATKALVAPAAPKAVWNAPAEVSMSGDVIYPAIYALEPETAMP